MKPINGFGWSNEILILEFLDFSGALEDARSRGVDESRLEMLVRSECGRSKSGGGDAAVLWGGKRCDIFVSFEFAGSKPIKADERGGAC